MSNRPGGVECRARQASRPFWAVSVVCWDGAAAGFPVRLRRPRSGWLLVAAWRPPCFCASWALHCPLLCSCRPQWMHTATSSGACVRCPRSGRGQTVHRTLTAHFLLTLISKMRMGPTHAHMNTPMMSRVTPMARFSAGVFLCGLGWAAGGARCVQRPVRAPAGAAADRRGRGAGGRRWGEAAGGVRPQVD